MRSIGSGARKPRTSSGTTTSPSGFCRSLATFAANFTGATPADAVRSSSLRIASLTRRAIASPLPNRLRLAVTSRNASSTERPSTSGV
jgi:hypothetical protein